ncbi:hypothetical protein AY600_04810 [Phormidium willei BDU 130791]|nr:hypothetical protein AY600_04810 [Phormidium willei BDU 130791]
MAAATVVSQNPAQNCCCCIVSTHQVKVNDSEAALGKSTFAQRHPNRDRPHKGDLSRYKESLLLTVAIADIKAKNHNCSKQE